MNELLGALASTMEGELFWDHTMRLLYATDASAYRELPLAVAFPKEESDLVQLIKFANTHNTSLIPRTAGTSLSGQVVGEGIVVDVSRYFTTILEVNEQERWVRVQPGVVRDELNKVLQPYGLFFGPETSTANRAMIGGMVGNNSCGSNSLIYGSTREHTLAVTALLSDGTTVCFEELTFEEFIEKTKLPTLEGRLYLQAKQIFGNYENQERIREEFPKKSIPRRNTGYAIDLLAQTDPFVAGGSKFNFCQLLCGSEGTLAFMTEIKLQLHPVSTKPKGLLCIHLETLQDALQANLVALKHQPQVSELMDHYILECTRDNLEQRQNRFFVQGNPQAILIVEYEAETFEQLQVTVKQVEVDMRSQGLGYHFPLVTGADMKKVWSLRKAGLGLLSNLPGDEKAVAVIEDTAVDVRDLPAYIKDFNSILSRYDLYAVHYAHAATGELHLRPIINLKTEEGNKLFRTLAYEIAKLVKKYRGSLSGEHGDGRLRGEFISMMIGGENYQLLKDIKRLWDPNGVFNPGKIVDTPPMNSMLRYTPGLPSRHIPSVFRYPGQTFLQHVEQCNGSGDCRKSHIAGGTMCPSYMVTKNEKDTTRGRANMLREMMTYSTQKNPFNHPEIKEVLDLCISCKGCKSECPSSVDMAKLKAEFMHGYYKANGIPLRARLIGNVDKISAWGSVAPWLYNGLLENKHTGRILKKTMGFAVERSLPHVAARSLFKWFIQRDKPNFREQQKGSVYFFCDEFTNYNDVSIGQKAVLLLEKLGYEVLFVKHAASGRALLSKGLLVSAKRLADKNVEIFRSRVQPDIPLVGVEPSAILSFRDEYPDLVSAHLEEDARHVAKSSYMIEEFLMREMKSGHIARSSFCEDELHISLHTHCQQKALRVSGATEFVLNFPKNFTVDVIPSGCCGMAGSFGYETEHYDLSMKIGELVLFPTLRNAAPQRVVVAPGTSCRHQIKDGVNKRALHPVEVLFDALSQS